MTRKLLEAAKVEDRAIDGSGDDWIDDTMAAIVMVTIGYRDDV